MVALFVPSPLAKRLGEVNWYWERYRAEHFKDILQDNNSKVLHNNPNCRGKDYINTILKRFELLITLEF